MKKQNKKYSKPRRSFDKVRMAEESELKNKYGLKSKREIWKADAAISTIRNRAKKLITANENEKKKFIERLRKKGFNVNSIRDALALNKESWLKRRLQTILFSRGLANTVNQSRQLIVHKHVSVKDRIVNIPSYQVSLEKEPLVKLNITLKTEKPKSKEEQIKEQVFQAEEEAEKEIEEALTNPIVIGNEIAKREAEGE